MRQRWKEERIFSFIPHCAGSSQSIEARKEITRIREKKYYYFIHKQYGYVHKNLKISKGKFQNY